MLYSLHILSLRTSTVNLAYYFFGSAQPNDDVWENQVRKETQPLWSNCQNQCISTSINERLLVLLSKQDLLFILSGNEQEDELSLISHLQNLYALLNAVCEDRLTSQQIINFHGKIIQCFHEAYPEGIRRNTNVESVLRLAKLKAVG